MSAPMRLRRDVDLELLSRLRRDLLQRDDLDSLAELLSLAGNDTRLKILYLLSRHEELCVCDLAGIIEMSVPAISHQLRKLRDRGLVSKRRQGQAIFYQVHNSPFTGFLRQLFRSHVVD